MTFFPYVVNRAMKILFWARWCCQICAVAKCELLQANKAAEPGQQAFYIIKISMVSINVTRRQGWLFPQLHGIFHCTGVDGK